MATADRGNIGTPLLLRDVDAEARFSAINTVLGAIPLRALNEGERWTLSAISLVRTLTRSHAGEIADAWAALTYDAPSAYLDRVYTAMEEV